MNTGLLQQDYRGTERPLLLCSFWFVELEMATNSLGSPWMELLHPQIVDLCNQYLLEDYLPSCSGTALHFITDALPLLAAD